MKKRWGFMLMTGLLAATTGAAGGVHDFKVQDMDGEEISLESYKGKVLLIVNVASRCGFTRQYAGLQQLYQEHREAGLVVLGFPANNFGGQEPGTHEEIKTFCTTRFGVEFPLFAKISVKGDDQAPLYAFLTSKEKNGEFGGPIRWNFTKFLVGRDGQVVARFDSRVAPEADELRDAVKKALAP